MTNEHEETETLKVDVTIPDHPPRVTTSLFRKTKRFLMKVASPLRLTIKREEGKCWICGKTEVELGQPLEAHHFLVERAYIDATIRWDIIAEIIPGFSWRSFDPNQPETFIDDMSAQGVLLCKPHHTGVDTGIHTLPFPIWVAQKYLADGSRFNPDEVITHEDT